MKVIIEPYWVGFFISLAKNSYVSFRYADITVNYHCELKNKIHEIRRSDKSTSRRTNKGQKL